MTETTTRPADTDGAYWCGVVNGGAPVTVTIPESAEAAVWLRGHGRVDGIPPRVAQGYNELRDEYREACTLLDAIELFSPMNLHKLVAHLEDIMCRIDDRLGNLEYRLDQAGIKAPEEGIPDDVTDAYFTLPSVWPSS